MKIMVYDGTFAAVDKDRRINQGYDIADKGINASLTSNLAELRALSRQLCRDNSIAVAAMRLNRDNIIGTGLSHKSCVQGADALNDKVDDIFARGVEDIDFYEREGWGRLQALIFLSHLEDGEVFLNFVVVNGKVKVQCIPATRVCNPEYKPNSQRLYDGIQFDRFGRPVGFWVCNQDYTEAYGHAAMSRPKWRFIRYRIGPRIAAVHVIDRGAPWQVRGVPYLAPAMHRIRQLDSYTDAELAAAIITSNITLLMKSEFGEPSIRPAKSAANPEGSKSNQLDTTASRQGPCTVLGVPAGKDVVFVDPKRPNPGYDTFFQPIVRQIGMSLGLPYEVLVRYYTSSYTAARAARGDVWTYFLQKRGWYIKTVCESVKYAIIQQAAANGEFEPPAVKLQAEWYGPRPVPVDEVKDVSAATMRMEAGLTSKAYEYAGLTGGDYEQQKVLIDKENNGQ